MASDAKEAIKRKRRVSLPGPTIQPHKKGKQQSLAFHRPSKPSKQVQTQLSAFLSGHQGDSRSSTGTVSKSDNVITDPVLGVDV